MGEKWRRVDDEEDDDEVHLNIQEVWTRKMTPKEGGGAVTTQAHVVGQRSSRRRLRRQGEAPLGSPTTMGCEEEGERGGFHHFSSPTTASPTAGRRAATLRPAAGIPPAGSALEGGDEGSGVEGSSPLHGPNKGGARAPPIFSVNHIC
ncbi:hypothetical protein Sjap_021613 [Stephania japonica]|uniref:Uncharacterized protein n=1 Tax=Stephania japonica TaxID=461633 RepID=A0AAP0EMS7_9MAGN